METLVLEKLDDISLSVLRFLADSGTGDVLIKDYPGIKKSVDYFRGLMGEIKPYRFDEFYFEVAEEGLYFHMGKQRYASAITHDETPIREHEYLLEPSLVDATPKFKSLSRFYDLAGYPIDERKISKMACFRTSKGEFNRFAILVGDHNLTPFYFRWSVGGKNGVKNIGNISICAVFYNLIYQTEDTLGEQLSAFLKVNPSTFELFREILGNAIVHNAYVLGEPRLEIDEQNIKVISYCPSSLVPYEGISHPNPEIFDLFKQLGFVKGFGYGKSLVEKQPKSVSFSRSGNEFIANIKIPKELPKEKPSVGEINGKRNGKKNAPVDRKLMMDALSLIKKDNSIKREDLASALKVSARSLDRVIKALKDERLILGRTSNKNGKWILP